MYHVLMHHLQHALEPGVFTIIWVLVGDIVSDSPLSVNTIAMRLHKRVQDHLRVASVWQLGFLLIPFSAITSLFVGLSLPTVIIKLITVAFVVNV